MGNSAHNILLRSVVHQRTPEPLLGRAHALMGTVVNGSFVVGFLLAGLFAADHPRELLAVAGTVALTAGLVGALLVHLTRADIVPEAGGADGNRGGYGDAREAAA